MQWFTLLASVMSVCIADDIKEKYKGGKFFYFPGDGDNKLHRVDIHEPVNYNVIKAYARDPNNNGYLLYTRSHPKVAVPLIYDDVKSVLNSDLEMNKTTVILVHGWLGNGDNLMNRLLTEAFLENDDVNIIVFDWSRLANQNYLTAKRAVVTLGKALGLFIKWLTSLGVPYDNIHIVGFSLGGHIVGNAGRNAGSSVKRITALDPASPLWNNDENCLRKTDAQYVEVIHTNTNMYGYEQPCGHADFYPNGGSLMPGCLLNICSHSKAYQYMADSVKYNNFHANECKDFSDVKRNTCSGDIYPMGNSDLNKSRWGIFRVNRK
ncbi:pancreatic triacylglycerol lipase-like [Melitaea cinxia]|uniref:pancreatic triacylglycerol lipase-like n=1 Tax=Melitaea cinxia TaxID=113334 RepID=UPI001E270B2D|nr:pancreatic triacylglycerol lipase-like [Melitaea cinxia]